MSRTRTYDLLRHRNYESHALPTKPRTINLLQTLATNKAENRCYETSNATDRDYSKNVHKRTFLIATFICKLG